MTNEDIALRNAAQRYLGQIAYMRKDVARIALRLDKIRHDVTGLRAIVYDKDRVQVSPVNTFEEQMVRLDEITEAYAEKLAQMHEAIQLREDQIRNMPKAAHREILTERYLRYRRKSFERIADDMHMSHDWVRHLHTEALIAFAERYDLKLDT